MSARCIFVLGSGGESGVKLPEGKPAAGTWVDEDCGTMLITGGSVPVWLSGLLASDCLAWGRVNGALASSMLARAIPKLPSF